jgi:hypothetical protein
MQTSKLRWFALLLVVGCGDYGVKTRAVKGHEFGLQLAAEDKRALIVFLKTL